MLLVEETEADAEADPEEEGETVGLPLLLGDPDPVGLVLALEVCDTVPDTLTVAVLVPEPDVVGAVVCVALVLGL